MVFPTHKNLNIRFSGNLPFFFLTYKRSRTGLYSHFNLIYIINTKEFKKKDLEENIY